MKLETIYDLGRLATLLPRHHSDFKGKIQRWRDAHSSSADINIASEFVALALRVNLSREYELELAKMALIHAAIVAYARAFEVRSHYRRELSVTGGMTSEQRAMHDRLIGLRHESIGHHGPAGTTEPWSNDAALLVQSGETWQPVAASKKRVFEPDFSRAFHRHIDEIQPLVIDKINVRRREFEAMLVEKSRLDEVAALLKDCVLTDNEVASIAGPLLDGERKGRTIVIANDLKAGI